MVVIFGYDTWITGWDTKHDMPVYDWVGLLFMAAGLPFIAYGLRLLIRKRSRPVLRNVDFICPRCESVYEHEETASPACPKDGTAMELLEAYYDRHPDRRDTPVTPNK